MASLRCRCGHVLDYPVSYEATADADVIAEWNRRGGTPRSGYKDLDIRIVNEFSIDLDTKENV